MLARALYIGGASIFGVLGGLHFVYTFFGKKMFPRDLDLVEAMKSASPPLTSATTMWNACSTDQGEWLPIGHRFRAEFSPASENRGLTRFVRDREWCPDATTNSLCINRVWLSMLVNTTERDRDPSQS